MNPLHLAVYHEHLEIVKLLCEKIPTIDIVDSGKIPSSSGLANESEISINEYDTSSRPGISRNSNISMGGDTVLSNNPFRVSKSIKVRSLILFWALDKANNELLNYLWTFDMPTHKKTNWGAKNLEFLILLANDIFEAELFDILFNPNVLSTILNSMNFGLAMDLLEDLVINNSFVPDDIKYLLLESDELLPYAFVGAILHYNS